MRPWASGSSSRVTPGQRFRIISDFAEITRSTPEPSLLEDLRQSGGRNNQGHVTTRYKGGGHRRAYRKIDFRRDKFGIPGKVKEIEYDPNRSARIALVVYADGEKRYIVHPRGLQVGDTVVSGPGADIRLGNAVPLGEIPLGTTVHAVELKRGRGAQLARSAGAGVQVVAKEGAFATLKLMSGEVRMVRGECLATIGQVGNVEHELESIGQGGQVPLARQALQGARRGQEPGRPPAGRRRGQVERRPAAGQPVGQAGGREDAAQEEGQHEAHHPWPQRGKATQ